MKKRLYKPLALLCAVVLLMGIFAGCASKPAQNDTPAQTAQDTPAATPETNGSEGETTSTEGSTLFADPVEFSMLTLSHASWPFQEDWYVLDLIKEYTNVSFKVTAVDTSAFTEKLNLTMASGELPDLIFLNSNAAVQQYGPQGAFINILDHIDEMPHFKAWFEANKDYALNFLSAGGELYQLPAQGINETNRRGWLYRADIFEELGIEPPTNGEEFYNALVKMKEAYPDSYPLALRSFAGGMRQLIMLAPSWGTYTFDTETNNTYFGYDYDNNEWVFGPITDEYREMVEYYHKLYAEGLIIPNFLTIDTKGWQDVIANGDSFVTLDYLSRIDFFNNAMRESEPDFSMKYLAPPSFGTNGVNKLAYSATGMLGFVVSSQTKHLDEVLAYIDWMYSDEAEDLLTWGRPGELYDEAADATRTWKTYTTAAEMKQATGFETFGFYERYNFDGELATFTDECREATLTAREYDLPQQPVLAYTEEEQAVINTIGLNVENYVYEQLSKFMLGDRSLDEWDSYVAEVEALGLDQLKAVHESSYARVLAAKQ